MKVTASQVRPPGGAEEWEKSQLCWGHCSQGWCGRDPCTCVPWQLGGHQVQPLHPWWCPTPPADPTRSPAERPLPQPSRREDSQGQPAALPSGPQRGQLLGCVTRCALQPLPGTAHLSGAQLTAAPACPLLHSPSVGISCVLWGPLPPAASPSVLLSSGAGLSLGRAPQLL